MNNKFDIIRPYIDGEIKPAIERTIANPLFKHVIHYLYENRNYEDVIAELKNINSVDMFQEVFSDYAVKKTVEKTSSGLTYGGLENLDNSKSYLFVANHRDIVLDSAIMQIILLGNKHKTSEITFGSNLMSSQFIIDLGKMNKMFTFYRGGNKLEQYNNALLHSGYINHTIKEKKESVWIAQRDGRTKDGNDKTQISLIKMFYMHHYDKDICKTLESLNIVPVCISYEYEPCDIFKVKELYLSEKGKYEKSAQEDFESVMYGIKSFKGKIHMQFGTALNNFINQLSSTSVNKNDIADLIAKEIDKQIHINYKLNPVNYIAYDLINDSNKFKDKQYSDIQLNDFIKYADDKLNFIDEDKTKLRDYFYKIYSNPVVNFLKYKV